jgi:hypothetical protein
VGISLTTWLIGAIVAALTYFNGVILDNLALLFGYSLGLQGKAFLMLTLSALECLTWWHFESAPAGKPIPSEPTDIGWR